MKCRSFVFFRTDENNLQTTRGQIYCTFLLEIVNIDLIFVNI